MSATTNKFSPEVRTRAVLLEWVKKAEVDSGKRVGLPTDVVDNIPRAEAEERYYAMLAEQAVAA